MAYEQAYSNRFIHPSFLFPPRSYMDKRQMFLVKDGVDALCEETRTIAVPAVDAFG